ncbi:MAG: prolipoprotein diacylglyceryl transferase, partial [Chloroflexota bacterium]
NAQDQLRTVAQGFVGSIGTLLLIVGVVGALLNRYVPGFDVSQGIAFDSRESVTIGGTLQIRYYGIIIVLAMLVAANVAARLAAVDGRDPEHIWGALTWAIIPGIVLARLWFVTFPPSTSELTAADYYSNFFDVNNGAIAIWSGGLSIFGAVIGGFGGAYIYFRRNGLAVPAWVDIAAVALPLGQAIGRWANFINQELYGTVTTLPWGIPIPGDKRVFPFESTVDYPVDGTLFHPLFLYESIWSLIAFIVLLNLFMRNRKQMTPGNLFLLYLMQYSVIRFLLEFLRLEVSVVAGFNLSQVVTIVIFVAAGAAFYLRRNADTPKRKDLKDRPTQAQIDRQQREAAA